MQDLRPIERKKLSETVMQQLQTLISSGRYQPGDRLPTEKALAEALGVSRMSIREALSGLAAAGLIEIRHGEGSFVKRVEITDYLSPITASALGFPHTALALLEVRSILEAGAAELAALRATAEDHAELAAAAADYRAQTERGETGIDGDLRFHRAIARAAGNPVLTELMNRIQDLMEQGMAYTLGQNLKTPERSQQVAAEHDAIAEAIRGGDPVAARAAMIRHLTGVRNKLLRSMNEAATGKEKTQDA